MEQMIAKSQIKKIHALAHSLKWKEEWYRDNLYSHFEVESSKDLTFAQAESYIELLEGEAVLSGAWKKPKQKYDGLSARTKKMATPKQLRMIEAMWADISYFDEPEKCRAALRQMLERVAKASDLRFLTKVGAKKMVEAFKAMREQKEKKAIKKGA